MPGDLQPEPPPIKARSAATWAKLLVVWGIGLISWTIYVVAILYLWIKFL